MEIYGLKDPRDGLLRYVGKAKDAQQRLRGHLKPSAQDRSKKCQWLNELRVLGLKPLLVVLEVVTEDEADQAEREWIADFPSGQLVNSNAGGGGRLPGFRLEEEHKTKIALAQTGKPGHFTGHVHSSTTLAKMSRVKIGNRHCVGRKLSERHKRALYDSQPHLDDIAISSLRDLQRAGYTYVLLAEIFNVSQKTVGKIVRAVR